MAFVSMNVTNTGRQFTYFTEANATDGEFSMTVPYATEDTVGPDEGGTDQAVEANGNYTIVRGNPFQPAEQGSVSVPDQAVRDGETIQVEMTAPPSPEQPDENATNDSSDTVSAPSTDESEGNATTDDPSSDDGDESTTTPTPGAILFPEWLATAV
jgi:dolichyl-diphosphooligosaccharide--protein glycosyltransferase